MTTPEQRSSDIKDLALVSWREARGEGRQGMWAVATSIMNRVLNPKWWGKDVHSVVWKKWQYSSMTAPGDPQLNTQPKADDPSWKVALDVATQVYDGKYVLAISHADSYYDISLDKPPHTPPAWAAQKDFVCQIGRLKFYDTDHDHEAPHLTLPPEPESGSVLV